MERVKRRWWTMLTFAFAGLVIAAALISGLFQTAVYLLPNYRDDLSVWVTKVADRPVQIGGINLVWSGLSPRLDLADITLYSEDGAEEVLSAQRLSLSISLLRLLTGDLRPSGIALSGLSLSAEVDEQGHFSLVGFHSGDEFSRDDAEKWLRQLERFRHLRLENCELAVEWPDHSTLRFGLRSFDAARTLAGFDAEAQVRLPDSYGDELRFESEITGDIGVPADWRGTLSAKATGLQPQPWLRGLVAPGTLAGVDSMEASLESRVEGGRVAGLSLALSADNLQLSRAGDDQNLESLHAEVELARVSSGWRLELTRLQLDDEEQLQGSLNLLPLQGGYQLGIDAERLRLTRIAPYLRYVRNLPAGLEPLAGLSGELANVLARLRHGADGDRYNVQMQLDGLRLARTASGHGFGGLNGKIAADESGGRLVLLPGPLQLRLPELLTPDLPPATLTGALAWTREAGGWRLSMPQFGWNLAGSAGSGQFSLRLPSDAGESPDLDLDANFSVGDLAALKPWMPHHWGAALQQWLQRGVVAGRVPRAQLLVRGPLRHFPFTGGDGAWQLDVDVADARLDYAPGWPQLQQAQAQLAFRGNGLSITSNSALLAGNKVGEVRGRFADFHDRELTVDAGIEGETASFYQLLRDSPIAERLSGLLENTRAAGPSRVALHLDIPLEKNAEPRVHGTVELGGVQMFYAGLREPVTDIRGSLAFDHDGVSAEKIAAHFADVSFDARIEPSAGTHGVISAEFPYSVNPQGEGLSGYVPELVRRNLAGTAHFRAELPLSAENGGLTLSSNLKGVDVLLPAPLAKAAGEAAGIRVAVGGDRDAPLHVKIEYENRLGADIAMQKSGDAENRVVGLNLRLGPGEAPAPATTDLRLRGQVADLDAAAWLAVLKGADTRGLPVREADLSAARWSFQGQVLRDMRAQLTPVADGWDLRLEGAANEGTLSFRKPESGGTGRLNAKLTRLSLESPLLHDSDGNAASAASPPLDPNGWPALDFDIGQFSLNGTAYGALQLNTARVPGRGQKIENFRISGGALNASATGEWLRESGQSSARLKFEAASDDFTDVLKSLGYAQSLSARQAHVQAELAWDPAAAGLDWAQARGGIDLSFDSGALKAVEPGAGRMLGLLNFYALPRRLTLDFRDVVSEGLGFDHIGGHFDLGGGSAVTDNVKIQAPSMRMELRGRVGLAARDYDQRVTIYPDVSPGITLGAALLGGPAFAAVAFLAQQVLDKSLDQVTQLSYQVTGSWENPQVKRVDNSAPEPAGATRPRN